MCIAGLFIGFLFDYEYGHDVSQKISLTSTELHGIITQTIALFIFNDTKTSNLKTL
jgi:hypothetical protein